YSPSLLEERCQAHGRRERAEEVARLDQRTERAAEALAVVTGLFLAALAGMGLGQVGSPPAVGWGILPGLAIRLLGSGLPGVIANVSAEPILEAPWPASGLIRAAAGPLTFAPRQVEQLVEWIAGLAEAPRPASVEVEIPTEDAVPEDEEPQLPEPA